MFNRPLLQRSINMNQRRTNDSEFEPSDGKDAL